MHIKPVFSNPVLRSALRWKLLVTVLWLDTIHFLGFNRPLLGALINGSDSSGEMCGGEQEMGDHVIHGGASKESRFASNHKPRDDLKTQKRHYHRQIFEWDRRTHQVAFYYPRRGSSARQKAHYFSRPHVRNPRYQESKTHFSSKTPSHLFTAVSVHIRGGLFHVLKALTCLRLPWGSQTSNPPPSASRSARRTSKCHSRFARMSRSSR